ncbi:nonstructural protein [Sigmofec virus UA08Rod_4769]|uniref:Nonstructural protein n=1 Tax=Sigmofec virus UA08Rod_4769 TaxID=2929408 RepID=A0A976R718_9VIRU|nr:nonstructural protein [Sigmofec virus UA08Rod_4769]
MINEIYAIYDQATKAFVQFVPCMNERVANMTFEKLFKDKRLNVPMLYDYPNTFDVYCLGTFDDNTGIFENLPQHLLLLNFGSFAD